MPFFLVYMYINMAIATSCISKFSLLFSLNESQNFNGIKEMKGEKNKIEENTTM